MLSLGFGVGLLPHQESSVAVLSTIFEERRTKHNEHDGCRWHLLFFCLSLCYYAQWICDLSSIANRKEADIF